MIHKVITNWHNIASFRGDLNVLRLIVGTPNRILVNMCELHFNPGAIKTMLMQYSAHGMSEAVPG